MKYASISFNDIHQKIKELFETIHDKMGSKHLERWTWNEENVVDIQQKDFGEEEMYDNRRSSTILNKARTNTLQLNDRNRHRNKEINCMVCDTDDKEDIALYVVESSIPTPTTIIIIL